MTRRTAKTLLSLLVAGYVATAASSAFAAELTPAQEIEKARNPQSIWLDNRGAALLGAGIGAGLVIIGGAMGIGRIGATAVEAMARQPEAAGNISTAMIITAAMVEGATLFAVVVTLLLAGK